MPTQTLGTLQRVDLRTIWQRESEDFTPWLAQPENLAILGETVGLELELQARERQVGPFRADILCKDLDDDTYVLIENQLEWTDHKHLGQLLTYAAGLEAATIIWVAQSFTEEHRAAIDWLNRITEERFSFFGLEIELWRINDSLPAPKFNIVCKPNDWSKEIVVGPEPAGLTEIKRLQKEYWQAFLKVLATRTTTINAQRKTRPQHWMYHNIGRVGFRLMTFCNTQQERIGVIFEMHSLQAKEHFRFFLAQKADIEREAGIDLEWRELPEKKSSRIKLERKNTDPKDRAAWPEQHAWLADKLILFDRIFRKRVSALVVDDLEDEVDVDDGSGEPVTT